MNINLKQKHVNLNKQVICSVEKNLIPIVAKTKVSNGYEVEILFSDSLHIITARVTSPQNKQYILQKSMIFSGLTNTQLTQDQFMNIALIDSRTFKAIYLPETAKVYVWPNMLAAGKHDYLITNSNNNPFVGKSFEEVRTMFSDPKYVVPGVKEEKTTQDLGGFAPPKGGGHGNLENKLISQGNYYGAVSIHYDQEKTVRGQTEPAHVGIEYRFVNENSDKLTQRMYNFPMNNKFYTDFDEKVSHIDVRGGDVQRISQETKKSYGLNTNIGRGDF